MGEATIKIIGNDKEKHVARLQAEIASKRVRISTELEELRRRRQRVLAQWQRLAKAAGLAAAWILILSSLAKAIFDLVRGDHPKKIASAPAAAAASTKLSPVLGATVLALRWAAQEYIKYKLSELRQKIKVKKENIGPAELQQRQ